MLSAEPGTMQSPGAPAGPLRSVRARAIALGAMAAVPACYATANLPQSSMFSLLAAPVGVFLAIVLLNSLVGRLARRTLLDSGDLVVVFGMASVAAVMSAEWTFYLHATAHHLPFLADGNPAVADKVLPNLPDWMVIKELEPVRDLMTGGLGPAHVWSKLPIFLPRYAAWGALLVSAALACLCVNSLMRGAWTEREKLSFPIVQLPVAMSESGPGSLWRSRWAWGAFALVFAIDLLNGFQYLYPNLPRIPLKQIVDTAPFLRDAPWSSLGELNIGIYPFLAALGLLMPSDLLFSLILFFLLRKATHLVLGMAGFAQGTFSGTYFAPGPPYFEQQAWGGVLALFVGALYFSRGYLREVAAEVRSGARAADGGVSHRLAFLGLLLCTGVVLWFGWQGALPVHVMLPYFALFLIFSVVLTRLRAQLGPPTHEFAFFGPSGLLGTFAGTAWMSDRQAVWLSQPFLFMNRISRTHPMPTQLEAMKMSRDAGQSPRRLFWALGAATVAGFFLAYWFYLAKAYRLGSPIGAQDGIGYLQNTLANPHGPEPAGMAMAGFGFAMVAGLDFLRLRFPGFALHPAGYVLGVTYGIDYYWFGLLLALIAKTLVHRYSGLRGYEKLRHVALGLMLAEYAAEAIWMAVALITKQSTYTIGFNDRSLGVQ